MGWVAGWVELGTVVSGNHKSSNRIELSQFELISAYFLGSRRLP